MRDRASFATYVDSAIGNGIEGAVRLNGERITDPDLELAPHQLEDGVLQLGRRAWARVRWLSG